MPPSWYQTEKAMAEWEAWQKIVALLRDRKIEINDDDELNKALIDWAEKFNKLKSEV